jgi:hypothetical protein
MWGDVAPDTITFQMMSKWRAALEKKHGRDTAHKTLRVWRAFWKIMVGMKMARSGDPSTGIRNRAPAPRWQRWSEGETVRLVKVAWRRIGAWPALSLLPGIHSSRQSTFARSPQGIAPRLAAGSYSTGKRMAAPRLDARQSARCPRALSDL